ncbi:MAG TPA: DUF4249 family protein, partial [Cyclobacteriaceae bacterium]|nr:DUF4249 family protein [Cyclobacteriaceae bacterium]
MRFLRFIPFVFLLVDACVDPLQLDLSSASARIVVDGMITNEPGPYRVKLIYSSNLENSLRLPTPITGASVWIISSLNQSELLTETTPGIYESSPVGIQGQVGVSYHIKIITAGTEYQSTPQEMVSAGTIDSVYPIFSANEIDDGVGEPLDAFNIYIDSHGNEGDPNLYRWRWT